MRVLVLGAYRDVDLSRQHPLSHTLADLAREELSRRIVLRGLTEHDVARFIEVTAGLKPPQNLVAAVYKETEGNPFFVNEVVRLLVADGRLEHPERVRSWSVGIPQSVRDVVGRRLDRLSGECNGVLTAASVVGREFGLDVLEQVTGMSRDRLLELLDEACAARVVADAGVLGRYAFSHALVRETLYDELSTTRRIRLHRRVGEVLEAIYGGNPEPHLAELAHHFFEAAQGGDVDRAIAYAVRAGDRAAAQMAHEEAARHYEIGLQALELRERSAEGVCALLLKLSEALWRAGEYDRAKDTSLRAAGIARKLGTPGELARAALGIGGPLGFFAAVVQDETLVGFLEEALAGIGDSDPPMRALVLGRLAEEITFSAPYESREALCAEAVAIARRIGDPALLASTLRSTHWALWVAENAEERVALADEMIALAERAGDIFVEAEARALRSWDLLELTDIPGTRREMEIVTRLVEQTRQPYYLWYLATNRVLMALCEGRYDEAEGLAQQALQIGQKAQNPNAALLFGLQLSLVYNEQGRFEELKPVLAGALNVYPLIAPSVRCATALRYMREGREAETRQEFEALAAQDFVDLPRNIAWPFSVAYLGEVAAWLRDIPRCERLYALLLPFTRRNVTIGPVLAFGSAARYLGLLAARTGRWEEAVQQFEEALATNARMGMRGALAHAQVEYAEVLLERDETGGRERALELLNRALEAARAMGMRPVLEQALALKLRAQGVATREVTQSIDAVVALVEKERPDLRPHTAPDGTVTILFTDIEGSTALTERLGDRRAQEILRLHNRIVREQIRAHGGFEVKSQGDGFMVAFQSARRALQCAIAMQQAIAGDRTRHPETPLRIRVGLHTGKAIKEADDFFGKTVILAARIAAQAQGGEILVSSLLKELTESAGDLRFGEPRQVVLKGLSGTYRTHPVEWSG